MCSGHSDSSKGSKLHEFACTGISKKVDEMLQRGANVNFKDKESGSTPLIMASWKGSIFVVTALLNHKGVNVNIKDNYRYTALWMDHMQAVCA